MRFVCQKCGKSYAQKESLWEHRKLKHGFVPDPRLDEATMDAFEKQSNLNLLYHVGRDIGGATHAARRNLKRVGFVKIRVCKPSGGRSGFELTALGLATLEKLETEARAVE